MAFYESIYILRPDLATEQVEQVNKRVGEVITSRGGTILKTELWGRRQLAYPIKKNTKGFYVFHVVEGGGQLVAELESRLKIDEDVLKFQNVRVAKPQMAATPLAAIGNEEPRREGREGSGDDDVPTDPGLNGDHDDVEDAGEETGEGEDSSRGQGH
ncbi:MAG: 30S ribosomal protein S6 [Magnetococcales bacterium]|nr:30S ribosomal protein S6 [Magnetococcales bacterium]